MYGVESEDQVEQTRKDIYSSINSDEPVIVAVNDGNMKNSIFNTGIELEVEKLCSYSLLSITIDAIIWESKIMVCLKNGTHRNRRVNR